jgi:5-methylcytosine-specific restriction endonuclease McrA
MTEKERKHLWYIQNKVRLNIEHKIYRKTYNKQRKIYIKQILKELKINGCSICGYNNNHSVLEFHHVNPTDKSFPIAHGIRNHTNERVAEELNKCVLLCANCHKEIEFKEE